MMCEVGYDMFWVNHCSSVLCEECFGVVRYSTTGRAENGTIIADPLPGFVVIVVGSGRPRFIIFFLFKVEGGE